MGNEKIKKIIEKPLSGSTPLSYEDLEGLIPKYITTLGELFDAEFKNISEAFNKYFLSRKKFQYSIDSFYKVHKDMFNNVWNWAGKRRNADKTIGINFLNIDIELKRLLDDYHYWMTQEISYIEISAWLHHRLVYIHPFNNGNGRWARFVVNLFLKDHLCSYLKFPEEKLILRNEIRADYILALKEADNFNYTSLIAIHNRYLSEL